MIFDSHAHYDDEAFEKDRQQVIEEVTKSNVGYIVDAGSDIESSRLAVELSEKFENVYAAVGIHPLDADKFDKDSILAIRELCSNRKVVAIGEIGLDYYYKGAEKETQKSIFKKQLDLALELNLPVVIHDREAHGDTYDIIKEYQSRNLRGVFHCYSGSLEMARQYIGMGFYIGFTGVITFKNAKKAIEVLSGIPLNRILIETDCPYLTPVPFRGKRNDSRHLKYVIDKACEVLNLDQPFFEDLTCRNAKTLFGI